MVEPALVDRVAARSPISPRRACAQCATDVPLLVLRPPTTRRASRPIRSRRSTRDADDLAVLLFTAGTAGAPKPAMLTHGSLLANLEQMQAHPGSARRRRRRRARGAAVVPRVRSQRRARSLVDGGRERVAHRSLPSDRDAGARPRRRRDGRRRGARDSRSVARARREQPRPPTRSRACGSACRARRRSRPSSSARCASASRSTCTTATGSPKRRRSSRRARSRRSRARDRSVRRCPASRCGSSTPTATTCSKAIPARSSCAAPTCSRVTGAIADATARVLGADGWLHTGDVGVADDDGWLSLVERAKDVVIVSGFNVYPGEVEHVLAQHADVADVAVVGEPHPRTGETVVAYVVREAGNASRSGRVAAARGPAPRALQAPDARRARRRAAALVRGQVAAPRAVAVARTSSS